MTAPGWGDELASTCVSEARQRCVSSLPEPGAQLGGKGFWSPRLQAERPQEDRQRAGGLPGAEGRGPRGERVSSPEQTAWTWGPRPQRERGRVEVEAGSRRGGWGRSRHSRRPQAGGPAPPSSPVGCGIHSRR